MIHYYCCRCDATGPFCNVTVDHVLNMTIGQRLLGEPIWIGLIVILSVLLLFGILCVVRRKCAKRYACCQIQFKQKDTESKCCVDVGVSCLADMYLV